MYVKCLEVNDAFQYIKNRESLAKIYVQVDEEMRKMIEKYGSVLSDSERCKAYSAFWGCRSTEEYYAKFFNQVLVPSYNVFDKTHLRYIAVLNAIKVNNPEWVTVFENIHKRRLEQCKVSVYSLEEALTT